MTAPSVVPAGIMFHHLHGDRHLDRQGSIDTSTLEAMLDFLSARHRLLPARDWRARALENRLRPGDLCLTFDDALACQAELAAPVLEGRGLTAFFFVYRAALEGEPIPLEVDAHVRHACFEDMPAFYASFFSALDRTPDGPRVRAALAAFEPALWRPESAYYSDDDRRFRFVRDQVLTPAAYRRAMDRIVDRHVDDRAALAASLVMNEADVVRLHERGHVIGLHSDTHPTHITRLESAAQRGEFARNQAHLESLLGDPVDTMAHPCGIYDQRTLDALGALGIRIGFRADLGTGGGSHLELPRLDHALLLRQMEPSRR